MNKLLFTIAPSEKRRILEMHQSATKKHYLSEQTEPATSTPEGANKESLDYKNDSDLIKIQNNINSLNKITKNFPAKDNANDVGNYRQEFWYDKPYLHKYWHKDTHGKLLLDFVDRLMEK